MENDEARPSAEIKTKTKNTNMELSREVKSHLIKENDIWRCKTCDRTFQGKSNAQSHAEIHVAGLSYSCKLCEKMVKRRRDMRQHIEAIHITGFVHYCDVCGNGSRTRKALSEHKRQAGHQTPQEPIQNYKVSVNPEEIDETVKSLMEYGKYIGVSGKGQKIRARVCKACGKEGRMNNVMRHIERNHIDSGVPNSCNDCGKTFGHRAALKFHQKGTFCFSLPKLDMGFA